MHDEAELERALELDCRLIGINNRNLNTFETDLATTAAAGAAACPRDRIVVAESGLFTPADIARLAAPASRTFLIGESLMRQADVAAATRALLRRSRTMHEAEPHEQSSPTSTRRARRAWSMSRQGRDRAHGRRGRLRGHGAARRSRSCQSGDTPKGDVLAIARIAGIMAAKRTPS